MSAAYFVDECGVPRITPIAAAHLDEANFRQAQREAGLLVGGPLVVCGCGRERSHRIQACESCGKDLSFAAPLFPVSFPREVAS